MLFLPHPHSSRAQALNITLQSFISQRRSRLEWDRTAPSSTISGPTEYLVLKGGHVAVAEPGFWSKKDLD